MTVPCQALGCKEPISPERLANGARLGRSVRFHSDRCGLFVRKQRYKAAAAAEAVAQVIYVVQELEPYIHAGHDAKRMTADALGVSRRSYTWERLRFEAACKDGDIFGWRRVFVHTSTGGDIVVRF
jgi:hypothetical protein